MVPIIKSGRFEFSQLTKSPAKMTPRFMIISLEVNIILAFICASSLLFEHAVERAIILSESSKLSSEDFLLQTRNKKTESAEEILNLSEMEKRLILKALEKNNGNVKRAAKDLGIDRLALYRRLQKYGL